MPELYYLDPNTGDEFTVELDKDEISIGRSDANTIVVVDKAISRNHAVIRRTAKGFVLVDNSSANGSFVNNTKVIDHILEHDDVIRLGATSFRFLCPPGQEATMLLDAAEELRKAKEEVERTVVTGQEIPPMTPPQAPAAPAPPRAPAAPAATPQAPPPAPPVHSPAPPMAAPQPPLAPQSPPPQSPPARPAPGPIAPPLAPPMAPPAAPQIGARPMVAPPQAAMAPAAARPLAASGAVVYASFWIRLLAYVLDGLILGLALGIIQVPFALIAGALGQKQPALAIIIAVVGWLIIVAGGIFYVLYFWATRGATPAKKLLGLKIVREDGVEPMGWGKAALRMVGYMASGFILYIGFLMALFTERNRCLHDMIAGTVVIKTK